MTEPVEVELSGELTVAKADTAQQLVFGWATVAVKADGSPVFDAEDDGIDPVDLEKAAYDFVLTSRETGTDHDGGPARGQLVESLVTTVEKQQKLGLQGDELPVGWWVGFHVNDPAAWESVAKGERLMFSIEGTAIREEVHA